jgi:sugar phosphate isomerase/epimerase
MKLAICNELFERWDLPDTFALAGDLGFDGVELAPYTIAESAFDITARRRESIRIAADRAGVAIVGLHWLLVAPKGLHLTTPDATTRNATRDYFLELIRLCADLGGTIMVVGSPRERSLLEGVSYREAFEYARETFVRCAELAGDKGVTLCFEPLNSRSTDFINTPAEAAELIRAVGHPHFQMILDVYSSSAEGLDIPAEIRAHRNRIRHVHANDDNGYAPGSGHADYASIVQALREARYEGYLSVEVFDFRPDPETIARQSAKFLHGLVAGRPAAQDAGRA